MRNRHLAASPIRSLTRLGCIDRREFAQFLRRSLLLVVVHFLGKCAAKPLRRGSLRQESLLLQERRLLHRINLSQLRANDVGCCKAV